MDYTKPAVNNSENKDDIHYPAIIIFLAKFFSYIFHPLFIPFYAVWYLAFVNQSFFIGFSPQERSWVLIRILLNMIFFPALSVLLLKQVGFIQSIFLKTQRDRIIPYLAAGTFYFWMYLVFRNQPEIPLILTSFVFGVFLSSSIALLANIYFKISIHAIACGGLVGLMTIILNSNSSSQFALPFMIVLLITGIVCTSRLIVSDHSQRDIYFGIICGFFCQMVSAAFVS